MKKVMISALALMLVLCACSEKNSELETTVTEPSTSATTVPVVETLPEVTEAPTEAPTVPTIVETIPEETEPEGTPGTVISRTLNIREFPGVNFAKTGQLKYGDTVWIYEVTKEVGMTWGRIDEGWIAMQYVDQKAAELQVASQREKPMAPAESDAAPHSEESDTILPEVTPETTPEAAPETSSPETVPPSDNGAGAGNATEATTPVHSHTWVPIQNIPAEYEERPYVVCSCGARFSNSDEWSGHRDSFLGSDELSAHTGYSSGSDRVETAPPMTVWQCSGCGISKTISSWDNP